jgi:C1A family cysteine protease
LRHLDQLPVEGLQIPYAFSSSYDWRDYGKVTPIKDQNPCGTCWVFGTTSVLESAVLIGESVGYNFSEQSVALCVDRSWVYLYDDPTDPCNAGGWSWLASGVFIKKGSVLESCNPYNPSALNCDGSCVCDTCPPIKKVDGYRLATNDGSQIDVIKDAVYNHEPVTVAYQHDSDYLYVDPTYGYIHDNYPCYGYANHLVSIIGWDDDVPHPNPNHGGTGAWIVKNSWGTDWGNSGFFYLAYDSSCVQEIAYLEYKDPVPGEELLYWDEAGQVDSAGYGDNDAWMASVFTADQDSNLTHVDFWTTSNNAQYEIYVWDGSFGTQLAHQTGSCQEYGYYSIPLSAPISIDVGQQFTVGVKMTTPGYDYPIPVEYEITGTVDPPIQTDVSFIRNGDGDSWEDLADYGWNACLRARMVSEVAGPDIWVNPPSFDVMLYQGDTWSEILEIGNDGDATLTYSIGDFETTGGPCFKWVAQEPDPLPADEVGALKAKVHDPDGLGDIDYMMFWVTQNPSDRGFLYDDGVAPDETAGDGIFTAQVYGTTGYGEEFGMILEAKDFEGHFTYASFAFSVDIPEGAAAAEGMLAFGSTVHEIPASNAVKFGTMPEDCPWLDEDPTSGSVEPNECDEITVSIDTTDIDPGEYCAEIIIFNNDLDENPTVVPVQLTVEPPECRPCESVEVEVSINDGGIPYRPGDVFIYEVSVRNNQGYKETEKSRIAITYGLMDDPTSHTLIIGTRMPDIYLDDEYFFRGDFKVPDGVYSGRYIFFVAASDLETGCSGIDAEPYRVKLMRISTTSKEEAWENWLEIVE